MIEEKISDLIAKELRFELQEGEPLTPEEKKDLDSWLGLSVRNRRWYESVRQHGNVFHAMVALEKASTYQQKDETRFLARMAQTNVNQRTARVIIFRSPYLKVVAAATVVLAIAAGAYHFAGKVFHKESPLASQTNDIQPGFNRAILKRANGTHIDLAAVPTGKIGLGSSSIEKLDSTQIVYNNGIAPVLKPNGKPAEIQYDTIETPRGGMYKLILPDGSKVVLNAASSLRFPNSFTGTSREVSLSGEAYFDIAKRPGAPFIVHVQNMSISVLGTSLGVADYPEDGNIKTTLIDGSLRVQTASANRLLYPGEQATVHLDGQGPITIRSLDDPETAVAFANGMFEFDRDSITSVMNQLARWYSVDVVYTGHVRKTFTGSLSRRKNASEILKVLQASGGVNFKIDGSKIIVQP